VEFGPVQQRLYEDHKFMHADSPASIIPATDGRPRTDDGSQLISYLDIYLQSWQEWM